MKHYASPSFWQNFELLPKEAQEIARKNFDLLKQDPRHRSLFLKKVSDYWSARVGLNYRALAVECENGLLWFWIGTHQDYDKLIR